MEALPAPRFASSDKPWKVTRPGADANGRGLVIAALSGPGPREHWALSDVHFYSNGCLGRMVLDTGASVTAVSLAFARKAGLAVRPARHGGRAVTVADGKSLVPSGYADVPLLVQLMLQLEDGQFVHWDRHITLIGAWVLDLGSDSPRDLFVSWADWSFTPDGHTPDKPLGSLARLVSNGAVVVDEPRAALANAAATQVLLRKTVEASGPTSPFLGALLAAPAVSGGQAGAGPPADLRARILAQIPDGLRDSAEAARLADMLLSGERWRVFGPVDPADCNVLVDFEVIGDLEPVSFRVPLPRKAKGEAALEGIQDWIDRGICEKVPWTEPAYGFVIVVPKANGKFRVTINPTGVNKATRRVDPPGGFMPANMVMEAMKAGREQIGAQLDMAEAFVTLKLGAEAQRVSTYTSPIGKLRWKQGYFGWHSFPAVFQQTIMERVVLPTKDRLPTAVILAWIDDIICAAGTVEAFLQALTSVVDCILGFGGRLSLAKCRFLVTQFDWCGVELDLRTQQWRIAQARVAALREMPLPRDREGLQHVLGVLRYYYFGVADQLAQRARLGKLAELDVEGSRVAQNWTEQHTVAMREALEAIAAGDWAMVFDPSQPVYVTTDASGSHGFSVVANQWDKATGKPRPIAYHSQGWKGIQLTLYTAQMKECYAQYIAVTKIMPDMFPHADVVLLCDNRNLATEAESADVRVARWQSEIRTSGCLTRYWVPGVWNTIADYGSRTVQPQPAAPLSSEEEFELHLYALLEGGRAAQHADVRLERREADAPPAGSPCADRDAGSAAAGGGTVVGVAAPEASAELLTAGADGRAAAAADDVPAAAALAAQTPAETVVPGHLPMAAMTAKIVKMQETASSAERAEWTGPRYTRAQLGGHELVLFDNRLVVPRDAKELQEVLMRMAHDDDQHLRASGRTLLALRNQCRVHWKGMQADVEKYVASCFRCQFAKAPHETDMRGVLNPTLAPYVHHTWYVDIKGPMPYGTGYIMVVVEALSRVCKLRYLPRITAKEVNEELLEAIWSFGNRPVVMRSDNGQPFDSEE